MSEEYLNRIPLSDIDIDDIQIIDSYNEKINEDKFTEAVQILDNESFDKGIRASNLDKIRTNIVALETKLLSLTPNIDTYYSVEEPTDEQMENKIFWGKPKYGYYVTFEKTDWLLKTDENGEYIKNEWGNPKSFMAHVVINFPLITSDVPMCLLEENQASGVRISYYLACIDENGDLEESRRIFDYTYSYTWADDNTTTTKNMEDYIHDCSYGNITKTNLEIFDYTDEGKEKAKAYLLDA